MPIVRRLVATGLPALLVILGGCEDAPHDTAPPPPARVEIPLGDVEGGRASLTRNLYVVFDGSGSMGDPLGAECRGDKSFRSKIDGAKWALRQFLTHVPDDVNLGLWIFDSAGSREAVPLGADNRDAFLRAVQDIRAGGGTPLAESMHEGIDRLIAQYKQQLGYGEFRLVVITDGEATGKRIVYATDHAAELGIPIYTIGLCIGADHALRKYSVSYRAADSIADLAQGLADTLAETPSFDPRVFVGPK